MQTVIIVLLRHLGRRCDRHVIIPNTNPISNLLHANSCKTTMVGVNTFHQRLTFDILRQEAAVKVHDALLLRFAQGETTYPRSLAAKLVRANSIYLTVGCISQ